MIVPTRRIYVVAGFLAAVIAAAITWHTIANRPTAVGRLADGSELRLIWFSVGNTYEYKKDPSLSERFQDFTHRRPQRQAIHLTNDTGHSVGWLNIVLRDSKTGKDVAPTLTDIEVLDENSGAYWAARADDLTNTIQVPCTQVILRTYPRRAAKIRVRCKVNGEPVEMTIPNLARFTAPPQWKAEPFPQTRRVGASEYTLKGARIEPMPEHLLRSRDRPPGPDFITMTDLELREYGAVRHGYEDETGNLSFDFLPASERVWRLRLTVGPQNARSDLEFYFPAPAPIPNQSPSPLVTPASTR